jgi:hypothetical protein
MNGTEILVGCGTLIGAAVGSYGAVKKWPFWKKNGNGNSLEVIDQCPVPKCHDLVIETATEVRELKEGQTEIFNRLNGLPKEIVLALKDAKELFR